VSDRVIEVRGLRKSYDDFEAVKGIDLHVDRGDHRRSAALHAHVDPLPLAGVVHPASRAPEEEQADAEGDDEADPFDCHVGLVEGFTFFP